MLGNLVCGFVFVAIVSGPFILCALFAVVTVREIVQGIREAR